MKRIKKVVFGFLMAAALCSFVACKSEGEKLAEQSIVLQKRAEKAAKYAEKYEAYLEEDEEE